MTSPALVGLLGKKRSGKDTFAEFLIERHGFVRVAFADPLREAAIDADPFLVGPLLSDEPQPLSAIVHVLGWEGLKDSKYAESGRRFLQNYGVAIREIDPDFWLRAAERRIHAAIERGRSVVVTDVRFPNEADGIEATGHWRNVGDGGVFVGGSLVRISRPGLVSTDVHVSETALDDRLCGFHADNGGTLADLGRAADSLVESIR